MYGRGRFIGGMVLLVGLILGALAIGALAYNAGVTQGATEALTVEGTESLAPFYFGGYGIRPFWPGSFLLLCLVIPFLFFLFMGVMKFVFAPWGMRHRHRGWGWKGSDGRRRHFEEMAREWHQREHGEVPPETGETEDATV